MAHGGGQQHDEVCRKKEGSWGQALDKDPEGRDQRLYTLYQVWPSAALLCFHINSSVRSQKPNTFCGFQNWACGAVFSRDWGSWLGSRAAVSRLEAATFNLGATVVLLVLFRGLASRDSALVSVLFHRNWYQLLARSVVVLVPCLPTPFQWAGWWEEPVVSLLTYTYQLWCLSLLLKKFPRLHARVTPRKLTNQPSVFVF